MNLPWVEKYKPKKSAEIPQKEGIAQIRTFLNSFEKQKKHAVLVHGLTGTCKTCAVHCLAAEMGYEVMEVNASDFRNRDQIEQRVGNALKQRSLFFMKKLLLIDEIDGLSGNGDRGGIQALTELLENNAHPVIMTANDPWEKNLSKIRTRSLVVEFGPVDVLEIYNVLQNISNAEGVSVDATSLKAIARRSGGDIRVAINDLQTLGQQNKKINYEQLQELGERDRTQTMMDALIKVLKNTDPKIALTAFDNVDEDVNNCFLWLDENIPKEYLKPADLARAYDSLSKASVFMGRIRRWQHWHYLVYVYALLSAGVSSAKDAKYTHFAKYSQTMRLLKIWQANNKYALRKAIAQKLAAKTHSSYKKTLQHTLPFLEHGLRQNKESAELFAKELKLDEEETEWLTGQ